MNTKKNSKLHRWAIVMVLAFFWSCGDQGVEPSEAGSLEPITPKAEYTKESPAEWAGLEDQLVPQITFNKGFGADIIVRVNLKQPSLSNYIEKIGIMDKDGREIVFKLFSRHAKYFEAHFYSKDLPADKSGLKVFSKSSLYDLWTTPLPDF